MRSVALCEIEAFAIANLVAKMEAGLMDPAPIWTDLKTFPWDAFRDRVDILTGGYPCQPFSAAGKRLGTDDPRHLWPYIASGIRLLRPRICFFENVEGHISLGLSTVISDLEELGYKVSWGIFSAAEVGAPHQRKRVFIMAYCINQRSQRWLQWWKDSGRQDQHGYAGCSGASALDRWPSRPGEPQHAWEPPRVVGNASNSGQSQWRSGALERPQQEPQLERPNGNSDNTERETEPALGGNIDGTTSGLDYAKLSVSCDNRADELRLLGNGVVPATAELAFRTLFNELHKDRSTTNA